MPQKNKKNRLSFLQEMRNFPSLFNWTRWIYETQPWRIFGQLLLNSVQHDSSTSNSSDSRFVGFSPFSKGIPESVVSR